MLELATTCKQLKCFVIVDLKTEKLMHQDIGQMDMYVRMFDELKRGAEDNPTLGIILCATTLVPFGRRLSYTTGSGTYLE